MRVLIMSDMEGVSGIVDCHGAGGSWQFNSLVPELLDPGCEWVAHHTWTCVPLLPTCC